MGGLLVWFFSASNRILPDVRAAVLLLFSPWGQFSDFGQDQARNFNVFVISWGKLILMGPETHMGTGSYSHRKCLKYLIKT